MRCGTIHLPNAQQLRYGMSQHWRHSIELHSYFGYVKILALAGVLRTPCCRAKEQLSESPLVRRPIDYISVSLNGPIEMENTESPYPSNHFHRLGHPRFLSNWSATTSQTEHSFSKLGKQFRLGFQMTAVCPRETFSPPFYSTITQTVCAAPTIVVCTNMPTISQFVRLLLMTLLVYLRLFSMFLRGHPQMAFFLPTLNVFNAFFYLRVPNSLPTPLIVDGSPLSQTNNVKYLGLSFSSNFTWSCHIESVFMRGQKICYVLKRLRSAGAPRGKLLLFTDSLLIPLIT